MNLSPEATDILKRFMCDADDRLGANGVDEIKAHPFFRNVDWKAVIQKKRKLLLSITTNPLSKVAVTVLLWYIKWEIV